MEDDFAYLLRVFLMLFINMGGVLLIIAAAQTDYVWYVDLVIYLTGFGLIKSRVR